MNIGEILDRIYVLPQMSKNKILDIVSESEYPRGSILLDVDRIEKGFFFIKKGIVRAYTDLLDHEITFWFGKEGDPIMSMQGYINNQKSYESIELLEDCVLYKLDANELKDLFLTDIHIANWGRVFAEQELLKSEERLIARQVKTASERYSELMKNDPELLQRIQLSYIASYLGITQVSMSRIRSKFR